MLRVFSLVVLAVLIEHLVSQIKDPRLTLVAVLIGGAPLLLGSWLRRSRQPGQQVATEAHAAPAAGRRIGRAAPALAGVTPARSEPAATVHERRWR